MLALAASQAAADQPLRLSFPVDCALGESCYIQHYVDRAHGPEIRDFGCGPLANDGHKGTDIALIDLAAMARGVTVRAAAAGTVRATRDGMPDINAADPDAPDLTNRSCGNAVIIDHADGWQTRYCHLRQGSIAVRSGDRVDPNQPLALVGLSGRTEFPHLHFTVVQDGAIIDPFQPNGETTCATTDTALWIDPIPYRPGGILGAGFNQQVPEFDAIKAGTASQSTLPPEAPAIVLWGYIFGGRQGDIVTLAITGPQGEILNRTVLLKRTQASLFRASGLRHRQDWPLGEYTGTITLTRAGQVIEQRSTQMKIQP